MATCQNGLRCSDLFDLPESLQATRLRYLGGNAVLMSGPVPVLSAAAAARNQ